MSIAFENRLALLALAGGLPATIVAAWFAWAYAPTPELRIVVVVALASFLLGCVLSLRRRLLFPLQTLANLIEAVRAGDYTLRGRRARGGGALAEVVREINALGVALQGERRASLEAGALVETVLEELEAAVLAFDGDERLRLANHAAVELLGRPAESLLGRTAVELGLGELLAHPDATVAALAFRGDSGRYEVRRHVFRKAGLPHTLIVASDLTRTLREEERRAWQRLIRVVGHEINNSLTPIKSVAGTLGEMLADPAVDREELRAGLALIGDRAASLSKFVATYSQLARLPPPTCQPVSLKALLDRLIGLAAFVGANIEAPLAVWVEADAGQLEQALINLLKNAVEANAGERHGIDVVLLRSRESAVIEIRDTGRGIANPDNLFVPFYTTKPGGSGIGLAVCRQIIEAHHGSLTLENRSDRVGCVARVLLPLPPPGTGPLEALI